jgi:hypothetical protein
MTSSVRWTVHAVSRKAELAQHTVSTVYTYDYVPIQVYMVQCQLRTWYRYVLRTYDYSTVNSSQYVLSKVYRYLYTLSCTVHYMYIFINV